MLMRVQAPAGLTAFSHQGHKIEMDGDGVAMIDERHFGDFAAHGFVEVKDETPPVAPVQSLIVLPQVSTVAEVPTDPRHAATLHRVALIKRLAALPTVTLEELVATAEATLRAVPQDIAVSTAVTVEDDAEPEVTAPEPEIDAATIPAADFPTDGKLTDEQVDAMTKSAMTAWLKAREVPVASSSDADTLRAKVRHASGA